MLSYIGTFLLQNWGLQAQFHYICILATFMNKQCIPVRYLLSYFMYCKWKPHMHFFKCISRQYWQKYTIFSCLTNIDKLQRDLNKVALVWATSLSLFTVMRWRRKWQPTLVFLPGESQGRGTWWAAVSGVAQSQTRLKWLSSSSSCKELICQCRGTRRCGFDPWVRKIP